MKKKILGGLLVVAIAAVAAFNVNMNTEKSELSALILANVEALAQEIIPPPPPTKWLRTTWNCKYKNGSTSGSQQVGCSTGGSLASCSKASCPSGQSPWY